MIDVIDYVNKVLPPGGRMTSHFKIFLFLKKLFFLSDMTAEICQTFFMLLSMAGKGILQKFGWTWCSRFAS